MLSQSDVGEFERAFSQLQGVYTEVSALAKKDPKDKLNEFKLRLINKVISLVNTVLGEEYRPFDDFDELDLVSVPSNSDVSFILMQYIECAERFRADNVRMHSGRWIWNSLGDEIRTSCPRKFLGK